MAIRRSKGATRGETYGWASNLGDFVVAQPASVLASLERLLPGVSASQRDAWRATIHALRDAGTLVLRSLRDAQSHGTVLEYELPREGGRRPDALLLQNGVVVVLEFKTGDGRVTRAAIDQVKAYARDLREYHSATHGLTVVPVLVREASVRHRTELDGVIVVTTGALHDVLTELAGRRDGPVIDLHRWLAGEYAPLPSLVKAAQLLFREKKLPFIKRAHSAGVDESVKTVVRCAELASRAKDRRLVLLTGVPGAGKTLVGLQTVHASDLDGLRVRAPGRPDGATATFLSGNGPLVAVLQNALGKEGRIFVQDMHRFIHEYAISHPERVPPEHLIVFDEAQRAWDDDHVAAHYAKRVAMSPAELRRSEPEMLRIVADRVPGWSCLLALIGTGQEIHGGEEAGIAPWIEAVARSSEPWTVHGPPTLAGVFRERGIAYVEEPTLSLDTSLRSHLAADLHEWVATLVDDQDEPRAAGIARRLRAEAYPIYVTRSLDDARAYARDRFGGHEARRFGLLASSRARNLAPFGLDPSREGTRRIWIPTWFNAEQSHKGSCCQLNAAMSEFQVQGLELDLPIVCRGDDFTRAEKGWVTRLPRGAASRYRDPQRLRRNAYRVLLTRGREGLVLFVPEGESMDATYDALRVAGAETLDPGGVARVA